MNVFGSLVVQNEADILDELLAHLASLGLFTRLFLFDLGSEDGTFEVALRHRGLGVEPRLVREPYTNELRARLLLSNAHLYREGDWLAIVDADELYAEDPRPVLEEAELEGAACVFTDQAEFALTDADLEKTDDPRLPIRVRRRHYLVDWSEPRFYRYEPGRGLREGPRARRRVLNRHYPFRTPEQAALRLRTRLRNRAESEGLPGREPWEHVYSADWRDYVMPAGLLHEDDGGPLRFGLPPGRTARDYERWDRPGFRLAENVERLAREREERG